MKRLNLSWWCWVNSAISSITEVKAGDTFEQTYLRVTQAWRYIGGNHAERGARDTAFGNITSGGREGAVDIDHESSGRGFAPAMKGRKTTAARLRVPDSQKKPS